MDHSARLRRETSYLNDAGIVLPMLPLSLCENKLSLFEGQQRLAKSVEMTFDLDGNLLSTRIFNSQLKNEYRRNEVDAVLAVKEQPTTAFAQALTAMSSVVAKARKEASENLMMKPEKLLQFFTILSASAVGEELKEAGLEASYRNQTVLNARSLYEAEAKGHVSVGVEAYAPWTGPMRNYAHLDVQRAMDRLIANKKPDGRKQELDQGLRQRQLNRMNGVMKDARMLFAREVIEITRKGSEQ